MRRLSQMFDVPCLRVLSTPQSMCACVKLCVFLCPGLPCFKYGSSFGCSLRRREHQHCCLGSWSASHSQGATSFDEGLNSPDQAISNDNTTTKPSTALVDIPDDESEASLMVLMRYMGCTPVPYGSGPQEHGEFDFLLRLFFFESVA